jgi:mitotic spindle assembly checkpoint protein MAD1
VRQYEALQKEVTELKDAAANEEAVLERHVREVDESKDLLEERIEDIKSEGEESVRGIERKASELETWSAIEIGDPLRPRQRNLPGMRN